MVLLLPLISYLGSQDLDPRYLRGFGSDGANVIVGRINGVATALIRKFPKLILPTIALLLLPLMQQTTSLILTKVLRLHFEACFNSTKIVLFGWQDYIPFKRFCH